MKNIAKKNGGKKIKSLEGMVDISPRDAELWREVWSLGNKIAELHNFHYVETPIVEKAELFEKSLEENGRIDGGRLFTFKSGTRTRMALRPEGRIPVMRSYFENQLGYFSLPLKVYYSGPMFRKNRKGEKRQFWEWGFEVVGDSDPIYDAQVIFAILDLLRSLKISDPVLKINAVGCRVCRPGFREELKKYYRRWKNNFCSKCGEKYEQDPIMIFRCQKKRCIEARQEGPNILNHLCQSCNNHFQSILKLIEDNGVDYIPEPYFFGDRGYYSKFAFEVYPDRKLDVPLAAGGRYDYLSERIGGRQVPSTGGVVYLDALIDYLRKNELRPKAGRKEKIFFVAVGDEARNSSLGLMNRFRKKGILVAECLGKKTLSSQLKAAERSGTKLVLIYGQKEVFEGTVVIREVDSGVQESIPLEDIFSEVKRRLRKVKNN